MKASSVVAVALMAASSTTTAQSVAPTAAAPAPTESTTWPDNANPIEFPPSPPSPSPASASPSPWPASASPVAPPPPADSCWQFLHPQNSWVNICAKPTPTGYNTVVPPSWQPAPTDASGDGWAPKLKARDFVPPWKRAVGRARPPTHMTKNLHA